MIVLRCPYCHEERTEEELAYGGEAGVERPPSDKASDEQWTDYLFMRTNRKGLHREQWCCSTGCGQWFKVARHTVTHEVREVLRFDEPFEEETLGRDPASSQIPIEPLLASPAQGALGQESCTDKQLTDQPVTNTPAVAQERT
jgi:sarcosine oxidase subunit delta